MAVAMTIPRAPGNALAEAVVRAVAHREGLALAEERIDALEARVQRLEGILLAMLRREGEPLKTR